MSMSTRPVYRYAELDRVLNPRSIAIVGAAAKAGSFGERDARDVVVLNNGVVELRLTLLSVDTYTNDVLI
jgi:hypothetical protein